MAQYKDNSVVIENTRLIFRNLAGGPSKFNKKGGKRTFSVPIDEATAEKLTQDGWNVKWLEPREEGDVRQAHLPVEANFDGKRPPRIVMLTSRGRTTLGADEVALLDYANIMFVDLIVNPYRWDVDGESGTKAYLKSMFVTIEEDYLDLKYADVAEQSAHDGLGLDD